MKKLISVLTFVFATFCAHVSFGNCTMELQVTGTIGAGVSDYLERGFSRAKKENCESVLLLINTPGGNLQTTRMIVEGILNSEMPVLCLVYPSGGHAGSAGAIILQSCHFSGALEATNIGAATPILGNGQDMPEDLRKKMINDTVSWLEGLTQLRKRNKTFSKEIVTAAKAVSAQEAKNLGAIDVVAKTKEEFLSLAKDKEVELTKGEKARIQVGEIKALALDLRYRILDLLSDPQFSYLIFMGSLALLYFEITHFGAIVPGVLGIIGLIISLISFHKLQVYWGGLGLLLLGVVFMIVELFTAGFGFLGVGGLISFVLGSLLLFDPETSGVMLPHSLVFTTSFTLAVIMLSLAYLVLKTRKTTKTAGVEDFVGREAKVVRLPQGETRGQVSLRGEIWSFESSDMVSVNDVVLVESVNGLLLRVKRK